MGDFILRLPIRFRRLIRSSQDNGPVRLLVLIASGIYGLLLVVFIYVYFLQYQLELRDEINKYLVTVAISIPTFLILWAFRTSDVKQQINKLQKQINQGHFNQAVENLTNISLILTDIHSPQEQNSQQSLNGMIKEAIGVQSLIELSIITPDFDKLITIMFQNKIEEFKNYNFVHNKSRSDSRKKLIGDMEEWLEVIEALRKKRRG